jgi:hypothetical protein
MGTWSNVSPDYEVVPSVFCSSQPGVGILLLLFLARGVELLIKHQRYLWRQVYKRGGVIQVEKDSAGADL